MLAFAFVFVVATQMPVESVEAPPPAAAPAFDIASVAVHLGKNVIVTKVDGSVVAGELLEVRRDQLVVRVYSFRDQPNVSRDVYLSASDIEAFRLGPAAKPAPVVEEAKPAPVQQRRAAPDPAVRALLEEEQDQLDAAEAHSRSATAWFGGAGIGAVTTLGLVAAGLFVPFVGGFMLVGAGVGCLASLASAVVGAVESGAASAAQTRAQTARSRREAIQSTMAF